MRPGDSFRGIRLAQIRGGGTPATTRLVIRDPVALLPNSNCGGHLVDGRLMEELINWHFAMIRN